MKYFKKLQAKAMAVLLALVLVFGSANLVFANEEGSVPNWVTEAESFVHGDEVTVDDIREVLAWLSENAAEIEIIDILPVLREVGITLDEFAGALLTAIEEVPSGYVFLYGENWLVVYLMEMLGVMDVDNLQLFGITPAEYVRAIIVGAELIDLFGPGGDWFVDETAAAAVIDYEILDYATVLNTLYLTIRTGTFLADLIEEYGAEAAWALFEFDFFESLDLLFTEDITTQGLIYLDGLFAGLLLGDLYNLYEIWQWEMDSRIDPWDDIDWDDILGGTEIDRDEVFGTSPATDFTGFDMTNIEHLWFIAPDWVEVNVTAADLERRFEFPVVQGNSFAFSFDNMVERFNMSFTNTAPVNATMVIIVYDQLGTIHALELLPVQSLRTTSMQMNVSPVAINDDFYMEVFIINEDYSDINGTFAIRWTNFEIGHPSHVPGQGVATSH